MRKIILITLLLTLTSCGIFRVHKMDVEQGNLITPEMTARLHTGMTRAQVKEIMGTPLLTNTFTDNREDYVYTYKPGYGPMTEKYVTLIFRNGVVVDISGNMYSEYIR